MNKIDRAFLNNYVHFAYMGHAATAVALWNGLRNADKIAGEMIAEIEQIELEDGLDTSKKYNESARVQTILIAKLMSEFVNSMEDCISLFAAIQQRNVHGKGITVTYSDIRNLHGYCDKYVLVARPDQDISILLSIPSLEFLQETIKDKKLYADIEYSYRNCFTSIRQVTEMFREQGFNKFSTNRQTKDYPKNTLNVVVEIEEKTNKEIPKFSSPAFVAAHNKIKHRFLVFEDMTELGIAASEENYWIHYGHYPRNSKSVQVFYSNIFSICRISAEVAALILRLDSEQLLD